MKKMLLLLAIVTTLLSCSKKDDDEIDRSCGTLLYIDKASKLNDGGIVEWQAASGCGGAYISYMEKEAEDVNGYDGDAKCVIFYKGMTRSKVKYIVAQSGSNLTVYVRYESNNIPQSSIDYWEAQNYDVEIRDLTGLEGADY